MIDGNALRVCSACLHRTRVATQLINAGFGEIAVTIASTAIDASTIVAYFRRSALVVGNASRDDRAFTKLTYVTNWTVIVLAASGQFQALGLWVARVVGWTGAFGSVIEGQTLCIDTTSASEVARVVTLLLIASHVQSAVFVPTTTGKTFSFDAYVSDRTVFICTALESSDALSVDTELIVIAVRIGSAGNGFLTRKGAPDGWVALEWWSARANGLMTFWLTDRVLSANAAKQTRVSALKAYAALVIGTAGVRSATIDTFIAFAYLS